MEQLISLDQELFIYLNNLGTATWDEFWLFVTDKKNWIPLYVVLAGFSVYKLGWKKGLLFILVAVGMIAITDQLCNLFKSEIFKRPRPCHANSLTDLVRLVKTYCGGEYGFVSAHSANHLALAFLLSRVVFRKNTWIIFALFIWAGMIAYSRIYVGVHYPGDVLFGGLLGITIAFFCSFIYQKLIAFVIRKNS